jgi:hypothetical protein
MIARFFSREKLDLDIPWLVRGEYIGELRRECFVKVSESVGEAVDDFVLCSLRFCRFRQEYFNVLV